MAKPNEQPPGAASIPTKVVNLDEAATIWRPHWLTAYAKVQAEKARDIARIETRSAYPVELAKALAGYPSCYARRVA